MIAHHAIWLLPLAIGCTEIPAPLEREPPEHDAGGIPDASGDGSYAGRCQPVGSLVGRGTTPVGFLEGEPDGAKLNYWVGLSYSDLTGYWRLGVYVVGWPGELERRVLDLGAGANSDLTTCVHCMVVYTDCTSTGACKGGPYFATAGHAVVLQMAEGAGRASQLELGSIELERATIDEELRVTLLPDEPCYYVDPVIITGKATELGLPCSEGLHCQLAAQAGDRHPE
jgi:hypothetical protein